MTTVSRSFRPIRTRANLYSFYQTPQYRPFITLPGNESVTLTETRILPYPSSSLYKLISDIDSYHTFLPHCLSSKVTKWSTPDSDGNSWPSEADLRVGWGGYEETFTSRLFCVPGTVVEALGGKAKSSLPKSELKHHTATLEAPGTANSIFESLSTKWTLRNFHYKPPLGTPQTDSTPLPAREQTEVNLNIEFQFSNPIYAALSKAIAPKVADVMIEAFEKRARQLLDGPGAGVKEDVTSTSALSHKIGA